jgi:hypothetical protein
VDRRGVSEVRKRCQYLSFHITMFSSKKGPAGLFLVVVIGLILFKGAVAWLTNSLSVLAQAADSLLDLLSGFIILIAVRAAEREEDEEHPYGHGKLEDFAGLSQGILIGVAGIGIIYSSIRRIISRVEVQMPEAGIAVMVVSILVSIWLSSHLKKLPFVPIPPHWKPAPTISGRTFTRPCRADRPCFAAYNRFQSSIRSWRLPWPSTF